MWARGANVDAKVANFVDSEQILERKRYHLDLYAVLRIEARSGTIPMLTWWEH
jgi:hypothetical protein